MDRHATSQGRNTDKQMDEQRKDGQKLYLS